MKGLKKLALATAVAAAPFAAQAGGMQPMDDSQMGDVTGQAGVTIELQTNVNIEQMDYSQETNGSFLMNGISIGGFGTQYGADNNATFDVGIDIDLLDSGDALISLGPINPGPVELGVAVDTMQISGDAGTATLMSNFSMDMYLTQFDIVALVDSNIADERIGGDTQTDVGGLSIDVAFAINDLSIDVDVAGMSISDFRMAGVGSLDALRDGDDLAAISQSNPAVVSMNIGVGQATRPLALGGLGYGVAVDETSRDNVLRIDGIDFAADMWIGDIAIGGGSVGSVALSGLEVTADIAIYGRETLAP